MRYTEIDDYYLNRATFFSLQSRFVILFYCYASVLSALLAAAGLLGAGQDMLDRLAEWSPWAPLAVIGLLGFLMFLPMFSIAFFCRHMLRTNEALLRRVRDLERRLEKGHL
jgi:hypothetical protein